MFPTKNLLETEYQQGWLDADSLKQYVALGNITQADFNQITSANK